MRRVYNIRICPENVDNVNFYSKTHESSLYHMTFYNDLDTDVGSFEFMEELKGKRVEIYL